MEDFRMVQAVHQMNMQTRLKSPYENESNQNSKHKTAEEEELGKMFLKEFNDKVERVRGGEDFGIKIVN